MKKILLMLCFLSLKAVACDTLTIRSAFAYRIGDTLDYKQTYMVWSISSGGIVTSYDYERIVVLQTFYNSNSDTLFVIRERYFPIRYPNSVFIDTIQIYDLDSLVTHQTQFRNTNSPYMPLNYYTDTCNNYDTINNCNYMNFEFSETMTYQNSLGLINYAHSNGADMIFHSKELIGYRNATQQFGNTIEDFVGIESISNNLLSLYPNPATSTLHLAIEDNKKYEVAFYNLMGQKIHNQQIANNAEIDVRQWEQGIYFYQLLDNGKIVGSGKVMKE